LIGTAELRMGKSAKVPESPRCELDFVVKGDPDVTLPASSAISRIRVHPRGRLNRPSRPRVEKEASTADAIAAWGLIEMH
jgi:hypothetical protein